jgi:undecaprenyl phosphate-alpha-L-ara4FN deformylase
VKIGLRIDVDTLRGTRSGVPRLLSLLERRGILATFFFSVGPDNMGRHLRRLLRPTFAWKMLRTRAAKLYGWDILLRGTLWPGPHIGRACADVIRETERRGHEVGLHAWDHHSWQVGLDTMSPETLRLAVSRGFDELTDILGAPPRCSAAPGWRCNEKALLAKSLFPFDYNSDCRGESLFRPRVFGQVLEQVQVPVTLPTFDEMVGANGMDGAAFNELLLGRIARDELHVLTAHAEVEGGAYAELFEAFLDEATAQEARFVPLRRIVEDTPSPPPADISEAALPGREGRVCVQAALEEAMQKES